MTVIHAFREAGILPLNQELVLRKMEEYNRKKERKNGDELTAFPGPSTRANTPALTTEPSENSFILVTPTKPKELVKMKYGMEQWENTDITWSVIQGKFQRGSIAMALKGGRTREEWTR